MPRQLIFEGGRRERRGGLARRCQQARGHRGHQPAGGVHHHRHPGRQHQPKINPYWGEFAVYKGGKRRPAAYKTGTTNDNRDVHAYGYLAPPADKNVPALAVGVWMGNSNNAPNRGSLSLDSSAPLWSAIMQEVSSKQAIANFKAPGGLVRRPPSTPSPA